MIEVFVNIFKRFFDSLAVRRIVKDKKNIFQIFDELLKNNTCPKKQVNIVGFRDESRPNTWNDLICVNLKDKIIICTATTDPGEYYTKNPLNPNGCAHLPDGYYDDIWKLGLHRGQYEALIHDGKKIKIWRDRNKNFLNDDGIDYYINSAINFHCAEDINTASAGCQVIRGKKLFSAIIEEIKSCNQRSFSYLLLTMDDCPEEILRATRNEWLYKENVS